jgi:DNA-binding NarL/FixJ family response regulator
MPSSERGYLLKDRVGNIEELADAVRQIATGRLIIDPAVVSQLLNRSRRRDRWTLLPTGKRPSLP